VGNFLSRFGASRGVCEDLSARLKTAGWNIIQTSSCRERLARACDMAYTAWARRRSYSVAQVDVYSGAAFLWAEAVCAVLRRARRPYILTLHGGNLPAFARRSPRRVSRLLRSAAAVTAPSPFLATALRPYCADIQIVPNPLDLGNYPFRRRSRPQPNLLWVRAFHTIYNPSLAVDVVALLRPEFPGVRLTMIGPDKRDGALEQAVRRARELGVDGCISFTGAVPKHQVPSRMQNGDIFLNTTNVDNTPVTVMEALACGLCVVSTDAGGVPDLVTHEREALLVPCADARAMAAAVRRLLTEPELANRLSSSGREKARQWDWSVVLPRWEALLQSVAHISRP
jgi:glycosyltransferase involved in cell wall biosynthesis